MKHTPNNLKKKQENSLVKCENQLINVKELVKPVDFEVSYNQIKKHITNDIYSKIYKISEDDVKMVRLPKEKKFINGGVPENIQDIPLNISKFCINFYLSDWIYTVFKEYSYNGSFFNIRGVSSYLPEPRKQTFIIDEKNQSIKKEGVSVFKTKGTYFEKQLALCHLKDYKYYVKRKEESLSNNISSEKSEFPKMMMYCLREHVDGNKILKESMPRDGKEPITLYLEHVESVREIGNAWILLSLKGKEDYYLYTGGNENQKLWFVQFKEISGDKKVLMSQDSLDSFEDSVQGMLSKFLQETENQAASSRRKDRQKILFVYSDIRKLVKKAPPDSSYDGYEMKDKDIRRQVEQSVKKCIIKLTATRFQTGLQIEGKNKTFLPPEPFFISMVLINIDEGRRISEEFFWNPNDSDIENMIPNNLFNGNSSSSDTLKTPNGLPTLENSVLQKNRSFLLRVSYPLKMVCLLIKVEKVFSGSLNSAVDKYCKHGIISVKKDSGDVTVVNADNKAAYNVHKSMNVYCSNIGHYRMPFAWSACRIEPTLDKVGIKLFKYDGTKMSDDDMIKQAQILVMQTDSGSKFNVIPAFLEFKIEDVSYKSKETCNVNSEYVCQINADPNEECCKEIREFIQHPLKHSNTNYSNQQRSSQYDFNLGNNMESNMQDFSDDSSFGDRTPPAVVPFDLNDATSIESGYTENGEGGFANLLRGKFSLDTGSEEITNVIHNTVTWEDLVCPNLEFSHTLYLYPRGLNFSNQNHFSRARNLSCFIEFRESDKIKSVPLKVIYSRPNNKQPAFDTWTNVAVLYHESSPTFNEEIKIVLPVGLQEKHNILFKFYHVSCDAASSNNAREKISTKKALETPVGFAWLPLLDKKLNIKNGTLELAVAANLIDDYLDVEKHSAVQWVDNKKTIFRVILAPYSSIYSKDPHLHDFFNACRNGLDSISQQDNVTNDRNYQRGSQHSLNTLTDFQLGNNRNDVAKIDLKKILKSLTDVNTKTLIRFLGPIFNQLIQIIVTATLKENSEISKIAITVMINLSKNIRDNMESVSLKSPRRHTKILKSFVKYSFDSENFTLKQGTSITVHEAMVQSITGLLTPPFRESIIRSTFLSNSFLFYSIILKSMIQSVTKSVNFNSDKDRSGQKLFTNCFMEMLESMIHLVIHSIVEMVNQSHHSHAANAAGNPSGASTGVSGISGQFISGGGTGNFVSNAPTGGSGSKKYPPHSINNSVGVGLNKNFASKSLEASANRELARFISRLLNVMDRGFVFQRIYQYMRILTERINQCGTYREELSLMKFEFLEIIINHEHYIVLNLMSPSGVSERDPSSLDLYLTEAYCRQHYLVGLLLQQVHQQMTDCYSEPSTRRMPLLILRNILTKHLVDDRYRAVDAVQSRIIALYLPLLSIIIENRSALCLPGKSPNAYLNQQGSHDKESLARPMSSASNLDSISLRSGGGMFGGSLNDGSGTMGSDNGSIYGVGTGYTTSNSGSMSRSSRSLVTMKDGKVDLQCLNQIAGLSDEGNKLRRLTTGRSVHSMASNVSYTGDGSDTGSIHSTNTIIGIDELEAPEAELNNGLSKSRANSLQKSSQVQQGASHSLGKKSGFSLTLNMKRNSTASNLTSRNCTNTSSSYNLHNQKGSSEPKSQIHLKDKAQRDLFVCLIHILGTVSSEDLKTTVSKLTVQDRREFLYILELAIHHLKYSGRKFITDIESISVSMAQLRVKGTSKTKDKEKSNQQNDDKATLDGNVSVEVGLVILDVLSAFCNVFMDEILSYTPDHDVFQKIIDIYLTLLNLNQSETVLCHVFVSLRIFINHFAKVLFSSCHSVICDLSLYTLRFCDSSIPSVRSEACGFLYRMMRVSFDNFAKLGFTRVHIQMIVAVSKLDRIVGPYFEKSLRYLKALAETELQKLGIHKNNTGLSHKPAPPVKPKSTGLGSNSSTNKKNLQAFFEEVCDLTQRIRTVLMATMHMNEHKDDSEMLVDLQYSLAKSYSSNPALRRSWLENIYKVHQSSSSKAEMAICKAHIAALIAEYLKKKENFQIGCQDFKDISPNIPIEENCMKYDTTQIEVHYTKEEVMKLLREVAKEFDSAGLWEVMRNVYKLLIPIYEHSRDYDQLGNVYQHLADGYRKIRDIEKTNQRLIGSYFRVVLFGKPFESLAGKTFVYRMPGGTQFCAAWEALETLFTKKYGENKVQILAENYVERDSLDDSIASIQITHVEPYFNEAEQLERRSTFERHYYISNFYFETPFIKSSETNDSCITHKQTEDLYAQWKRRTIITVESSFPHLKRRLEVISTKEIDFSPIERAIDEIKAKNRQLDVFRVFDDNCNMGKGQSRGGDSSNLMVRDGNLLMDMHLMGALLPQVNQGPMAYARVFLNKSKRQNLNPEKVKILKTEFMIFLTLCSHLLGNYYELMSQVHQPKFNAMKSALDSYRMELIHLIEEEIEWNRELKVISTKELAEKIHKILMESKA